MRSLNPRRLWHTALYLGSISWRHYVSVAAITYLVASVVLWLSSRDGVFVGGTTALSANYSFVLSVFTSVCLLGMLVPRGGRRGAHHLTRLLLLPASNAEKFVAAFVMRVLAPTLCFSVGFHLSVLTVTPRHFTKMLLSGGYSELAIFKPTTYSGLDGDGAFVCGLQCVFILLPIACGTTYLFGGLFFSRARWFLTSAILVCMALCAGRLAVSLDSIIDFDEYMLNYAALVWWTDALLAAATIALVWLSYRLFKRRQAVGGSIINI